jgi:hypothetical protein
MMMETRTVLRETWQSFFDSFSRIYAGSRATLEILSGDLGAQMEVENAPLTGVSCDRTGVELHFLTHEGHLVHRIASPLRISIEEGEDGLIAAIGIGSAGDDVETILRLMAPIPSRLLSA